MLVDEALKYFNSGLKVIPINSGRKPIVEWKDFIIDQSEKTIKQSFSKAQGIALACVDGIEALDFDTKYYSKGLKLIDEYMNYVTRVYGQEVIKKVICQRSPSGGIHLIFKSQSPGRNSVFAKNKKGQAIIESRGNGGFIMIAPSKGYKIERGDLLNIPTISISERAILITSAKCFNERLTSNYSAEQKEDLSRYGGLLPSKAYDLTNNGYLLLLKHGWSEVKTVGPRIHLNRPEAKNKRNTDATYNTEQNYFYCHTSSDSVFEGGKSYKPSAIFCFLECGGNFSEAGIRLNDRGFGNPSQKKVELSPTEKLLVQANIKKFRYNKVIKDEDACLNALIGGEQFKCAPMGGLVGIVGKQKSRKTTLLTSIVSSALCDYSNLNFKLNLGDKKILYFDTEQPEVFFQSQLRRLHNMAGLENDHDRFQAWSLRRFTSQERITVIDELIKRQRNIGCIVIDGLVDLCENLNESKPSVQAMEKVMGWSERTGALMMTVLHLTKGQGFLRGHIGTELQNKADLIIHVQKEDEGHSLVGCRESRYIPFGTFGFNQDDEGKPYLIGSKPIYKSRNWNNQKSKTA